MFETFSESLYSVHFAEIKNGKLILSDYIDSKGNDTYNGDKYNCLGGDMNCTDGENWHYIQIGIYFTALDEIVQADDLTPLPEFDCSDVLDSIKYGTPLVSPKTGDNFIIFFAVLSMTCFALAKLKKFKRIKNV